MYVCAHGVCAHTCQPEDCAWEGALWDVSRSQHKGQLAVPPCGDGPGTEALRAAGAAWKQVGLHLCWKRGATRARRRWQREQAGVPRPRSGTRQAWPPCPGHRRDPRGGAALGAGAAALSGGCDDLRTGTRDLGRHAGPGGARRGAGFSRHQSPWGGVSSCPLRRPGTLAVLRQVAAAVPHGREAPRRHG